MSLTALLDNTLAAFGLTIGGALALACWVISAYNHWRARKLLEILVQKQEVKE